MQRTLNQATLIFNYVANHDVKYDTISIIIDVNGAGFHHKVATNRLKKKSVYDNAKKHLLALDAISKDIHIYECCDALCFFVSNY